MDAKRLQEIRSLFPRPDADQRQRLAEDIRRNGVLTPVLTFQGEVVDGLTRSEIAAELGIPCPSVEYAGHEDDLLSHILGLNLCRRHLNPSQRAAIAIRAGLMERAYANQDRRPGRPSGEHRPAAGRAVERVAERVSASPKYVQLADKLNSQSPELLDRVVAGEMTLPAALDELKARREPEPAAELAQVAEAAPDVPRDALGHRLPLDLVPVFADGDLFDELERHLLAARRLCRQLCKCSAGARLDRVALEADARNLLMECRAKRPHTICPNCYDAPYRCQTCSQSGWLCRAVFDLLPEAERVEWERLGAEDAGR